MQCDFHARSHCREVRMARCLFRTGRIIIHMVQASSFVIFGSRKFKESCTYVELSPTAFVSLYRQQLHQSVQATITLNLQRLNDCIRDNYTVIAGQRLCQQSVVCRPKSNVLRSVLLECDHRRIHWIVPFAVCQTTRDGDYKHIQ